MQIIGGKTYFYDRSTNEIQISKICYSEVSGIQIPTVHPFGIRAFFQEKLTRFYEKKNTLSSKTPRAKGNTR